MSARGPPPPQVTEEVLSVLRLLHPLTEPGSVLPESLEGEKQLDAALVQLKTVARTLAISHTKQVRTAPTVHPHNAAYQHTAILVS